MRTLFAGMVFSLIALVLFFEDRHRAAAMACTAAVLSKETAVLLPLIFAVVSWRAYAAIPRYLGQPAWCQELIVSAGM